MSVALKTSKSFFPNAYMIPGPLGLHLPGLLSLPNPAKEAFCWADKPGIVPSVSDTLTKEGIGVHHSLGFPRPAFTLSLFRRVFSGVPSLRGFLFFFGLKEKRRFNERDHFCHLVMGHKQLSTSFCRT